MFECQLVAERAGLGFAVTDDARGDEVGVVEHRAVRVHERVAELAALVDGAGCGRRRVARDAAGKRELPEQLVQTLFVTGDVREQLGVRAFEVGAGDDGGSTVAGPAHEDHVEVVGADHPVEVRVQEVEPRGGAPVPEQPRFGVLDPERFPEEGVVEEVDLAHREVVRRTPPGVDQLELAR